MARRTVQEWLSDVIFRRQRSYKLGLGSPVSIDALADLSVFCRAHTTTFHPDPHVRAMLEGRREVWLRIQNYLKLSNDQLWELVNQRPEYKE